MTALDRVLLQSYLSDHLAGAEGGSARFRRMADAYAETPIGPELARIAREVAEERDWLDATAEALDVRPSTVKRVGVAVAERVGRLKPNGRLTHPSPLTAVLELDLMRSAVVGKRGVWETLEIWADELSLDRDRLRQLVAGADEQAAALTRLGTIAREQAFAARGEGGAR